MIILEVIALLIILNIIVTIVIVIITFTTILHLDIIHRILIMVLTGIVQIIFHYHLVRITVGYQDKLLIFNKQSLIVDLFFGSITNIPLIRSIMLVGI